MIKIEEIAIDKAITQKLNLEEISNKNCSADILRLDLIHNVISGNKYFKLKYHLEEIKKQNKKTVVTFGGAYSNHIVATALVCKLLGLRCIGVIRGEEPKTLSHTLKDSLDYGMELRFISRSDYKEKDSLNYLKNDYEDAYFIPEGGSGSIGVLGAGTILELTDYKKYSHIVCSIGTGTMYCGIVNSSDIHQEVIGIPVLKGMENILNDYIELIDKDKINNCKIFPNYHFGGYAKKTKELIDFMNSFYNKTHIPTDFVYSAKSIYAFFDLLAKDYFKPQSNILVIHCGGLQGNLSLEKGTLVF